ncbi:MAG: nuclear transport factor 2 family protein [Pseudomonadota bacterium]
MSQRPAVLFANDAFYTAFATGDLVAMDAVWARRAPVCCIHPGWAALNDRDSIMESWRGILNAPAGRAGSSFIGAPTGATGGGRRPTAAIRCVRPEVFLLRDVAWVACHEVLPNGILIATNIFIPEDGAWRMVHHHAGPAPPLDAGDEAEPLRVQ